MIMSNNQVIPEYLRAEMKDLCFNINNQNQVYDAMIRTTTRSMFKVKQQGVLDLLRKIRNNNIATNEVENALNKLCKLWTEKQKLQLKRKMMRYKISDAFKRYNEAEYESNQIWRKCKLIIPICIRARFNRLWTECIREYRKEIREIYKKKVLWLKQKWETKTVGPPTEYNNVRLSFEDLGTEFMSKPRIYGGVTVCQCEEDLLSLPPKFAVYTKINPVDCVIDCEKAITKLRWNKSTVKATAATTSSPSNEKKIMFFDGSRNEFDINHLQATQLPYNPSVMMPNSADITSEIAFQQFKNDVRNIAIDINNKTQKLSNLSKSEKEGLMSIRGRVTNKEIVCYQTDKSGRWSCDSKVNYINACEKHLVNNASISERTNKDQLEAERELNCHSLALLRILGLTESNRRIRNAVVSHGNVIAPFYCLRKDHKPIEEGKEQEGPKTRPVCGANDCQTRRLSYILCMILQELVPTHEAECDSTDVLLQSIEEVNKERVDPNWTVGSLDVEALYPSLDIPTCARIAGDKLFSSEIQFKNIQWKEVALYIHYHIKTLSECPEDVKEYVPKRKCRGKNPIFECSGSKHDAKERYAPWTFKGEGPDDTLLRKMFCKGMEIMIVKAMSLHDFTFNSKIYRQDKGGAIGLDLVGVIASIYMNYWDNKLLDILRSEMIYPKLYRRYVDDINLILQVEKDWLEDEKSVMEYVQMKANTIATNIQVTYDYSKKYDDDKLPVLDIKVWIGQSKDGEYKVLHTHYMKEVSSRLLIHSKSAHSPNIKFNVCVNEAVRIMKNCSMFLHEEECRAHVEYFVKRMIFSGYNHQQRFDVIKKAFARYQVMKQKHCKDGTFFSNITKERREKKRNKRDKHQWYSKNGKYESVMFVSATPESELKNKIQKAASKYKVPIKVVERAGQSIKSNIQKSNPFGEYNCGRTDCIICQNEYNVNCRIRGIVYQLMCKDCDKILYRGTTSRSMYERINEHFRDFNEQKATSVLWKHTVKVHNREQFNVGIKILSRNFGDPTKRLITESVLIDELQDEDILNSKKEWSYIRLPRPVMTVNHNYVSH